MWAKLLRKNSSLWVNRRCGVLARRYMGLPLDSGPSDTVKSQIAGSTWILSSDDQVDKKDQSLFER